MLCLHVFVCVHQVQESMFRPGDFIRVIDDMVEVQKYQKGHGEWIDEMELVSKNIVIPCV